MQPMLFLHYRKDRPEVVPSRLDTQTWTKYNHTGKDFLTVMIFQRFTSLSTAEGLVAYCSLHVALLNCIENKNTGPRVDETGQKMWSTKVGVWQTMNAKTTTTRTRVTSDWVAPPPPAADVTPISDRRRACRFSARMRSRRRTELSSAKPTCILIGVYMFIVQCGEIKQVIADLPQTNLID